MNHDEKGSCCCHGEHENQETKNNMIEWYFQQDHEEIDELFNALMRDISVAIEKKSVGTSLLVENFKEFDRRLEQHIRWEEETLFPAVENMSPHMKEGPGRVMRMEHVEIRDLKVNAMRELEDGFKNPASLSNAKKFLEQTVSVLKGHNMKEEQIYYPMADQLISKDNKKAILNKTVFAKS